MKFHPLRRLDTKPLQLLLELPESIIFIPGNLNHGLLMAEKKFLPAPAFNYGFILYKVVL